MASSSLSTNPHVAVEVREENPYPYPSHVCSHNFITVTLSDRDDYALWETQMRGLLESHDMLGFIDGTHVSPQTSVSGKEKVGDHENHKRMWRRSDALVKGWILEKCRKERNTSDFNAKDIWDELSKDYSPVIRCPPVLERQQHCQKLYQAILEDNLKEIDATLGEDTAVVTDIITNNGNTALHVAVGTTKKPEFLQELIKRIPEDTNLLDLRNSDGSTLLHVAATVGNTKAAEILVTSFPEMLLLEDKKKQTPLAIAFSSMHTETSQLLLKHIKNNEETQNLKDILFSGASGDELLATIISSKDFRLANELAESYSSLDSDDVLMALAKNFPCELTTLEKCAGSTAKKIKTFERTVERHLKFSMNNTINTCSVRDTRVEIIPILFFRTIFEVIRLLMWIPKKLVWLFVKDRARIHNDAVELLQRVCGLIIDSSDGTSHGQCFSNSIIEATKNNAYEVVQYIMQIFPDAISIANEDGHNIIQSAVISRSEKVYNLFHDMSRHRNVYRTTKDDFGNNLLHLAARLAPINKLNRITGAALQIQRELQWYKEVKGFVSPLSIKETNSFNETPKMIFTREHKDLLVEGEKWMKGSAKSFTIAAALITTIVFAAAITVPGGNRQGTGGNNQRTDGLPVFTNSKAFSVFAISDAISLFAAVTSLLMFLSVLTARYAAEDFLSKLPFKLIIGSVSLFISTTAMVIAFGATLYLVFGQSKLTVLIITCVLICLQITVFVILQFPLVYDLLRATYCRSIFGKIRDQPFY